MKNPFKRNQPGRGMVEFDVSMPTEELFEFVARGLDRAGRAGLVPDPRVMGGSGAVGGPVGS